MAGIIKISEASSLALHAAVMLAGKEEERLSVTDIAEELNVSYDHLSKVLQRLARANIVISTRGPKGGFTLSRPAEEIKLIEIYEVIEGPFTSTGCILPKGVCFGSKCILGDLLGRINVEVYDYLCGTTLTDCRKPELK